MIEIKNVCKTYRPKKGVPVKALDNVSLKFEDRGMVFILGKSGSGKSTLLNVLGGLDRADSGEIIIKGKSSKSFSQSDFDSYRNTFIGFIFQEYNILQEFSVGANIALAMELQGKKATNEALNRILEEVDLTGYGNRKPNELSGGQKQRVAIAHALIKEPQMIMADEPTGALDSNTGKQVFDTLKKLSREKLVLIVSHDRDFAELYADRIIELKDGQVISDVSKTSVAADRVSEGISVIEDKVIHIKKGYRLTEEDLARINSYIEKADSDTLISMDSEKNGEIRKAIKINDEGDKDAFLDTKDEDVKLKSYTAADSKLIRSRLPFKNSLKIGASSLKSKPVRLMFTVFLCLVSFALFGLADTVGSYDKYDTFTQSIIDGDIRSAVFKKHIQDEYGYNMAVKMNDADVATILRDTGVAVVPVYTGSSSWEDGLRFNQSIYDSSALNTQNGSSYYMATTVGFAEIGRDTMEALGGSLVAGRMPAADDEVVIPMYVYEHFKLAGLRYFDQTEGDVTLKADDITGPDSVIGKMISFDNNQGGSFRLKIVGVMETNFDSSAYDSFKPNSDGGSQGGGNEVMDYIKYSEMRQRLLYSIHSLCIINDGALESLIDSKAAGGTLYQLGVGLQNSWLHFYSGNRGTSTNRVAKLSELTDKGIIQWVDGAKTTLAYGEIIVPYANRWDEYGSAFDAIISKSTFEHLQATYGYTNSEASISTLTWDLQSYVFAKQPLPTSAEFEQVVSEWYGGVTVDENQKREYYNMYLGNEGYRENKYGDKSGFELMHAVILEVFQREGIKGGDIAPSGELSYYNENTHQSSDEDKSYKVVGYYLPGVENAYSHDGGETWHLPSFSESGNAAVIVSDELYGYLTAGSDAVWGLALGTMPSGRSDIYDLVEYNYTPNEQSELYMLQNEASFYLDNVNEIIEVLSQVFLYVGLFFAVFAALMLYNFISVSINYKKREIGILRAVGARSSDVFGIFFNESMIITLINFVLASVVSTVTVFFINSFLRTEYGFALTILNIGIRQYLLILGVGILVAFIGSFLPVMKIARKRPIDAIQNR